VPIRPGSAYSSILRTTQFVYAATRMNAVFLRCVKFFTHRMMNISTFIYCVFIIFYYNDLHYNLDFPSRVAVV